MIRIYKWLYYRFYVLHSKNDSIPEYTAGISVALLLLFNLMSIPWLIAVIAGESMFSQIYIFWEYLTFPRYLLFLGIYAIINSLIFKLLNTRNIINEFKRESKEKKRRGNRTLIIIIASTFVVFIVTVFLIAAKVNGDL